ncbi:protein trichome birefringence-like 19 [Zingiber officinale]|uniref:protein trichome birefringence-like 19 n=1 Tax=Zingiber officinale TaxID=94328 RepID=UPI001C4DB3CB|nr:protein trichome birefringence-like 19 [Zingiber officinale]
MKPHATTVQLFKQFLNLFSLFAFFLSLLALLHFSYRHLPFQFNFYSSSLSPSPSSFVLPQSLSPFPSPSSVLTSSNLSSPSSAVSVGSSIGASYRAEEDCDISKGEWVRESATEDYYYSNTSCRMIQDHQNCMKYGRPDVDFLRWRWRPDDCELPRFDPRWFLELVRGTSVAFVGDSLARNQMQSLLCLLSTVAHPEDISSSKDTQDRRLFYGDYNFTVAIFWTPFLVKSYDAGGEYTHVFLDEVDEWAGPHLAAFDYLILSSGTWWTRPCIYFKNRSPFACNYCGSPAAANLTHLGLYEANGAAFRAALDALRWYQGAVFLRTFSPSHFEGGPWNAGARCDRRQPEAGWRLQGMELELYRTQVEEFRKAKRKMWVLDVTSAMVMRPDGHSDVYGHPPEKRVEMKHDCVHWCLPGPVDVWNELWLYMLSQRQSQLAKTVGG